jgi:glycosyltransferase involved in cell wall biosynthesis
MTRITPTNPPTNQPTNQPTDKLIMHILFIVPNPPSLVRVRPYNLIKQLLRLGHEVTVATLWTNEEERADIEILKQRYSVDVISMVLPSWRSLWNCLRALPSGLPLQALYCWQPELARALQEAHRRSPFDIIHVEHLRGAHYGLFLYHAFDRLKASARPLADSPTRRLAHPPIVWDSVDCISHLFEQSAKKSRTLKGRLMATLEMKRTRRYEGWLLHQFDRVLVTSMKDKAALQALAWQASTAKLNVLPNGVALDYFTATSKPREPATLVISGKMSYHANVTAALHLVQDIMPHVWAQCPSIEVQIVGKDPPRDIQALASKHASTQGRVTVTGTVPDIRPYLRRATISVVPLTYGAGIQNKVLEAMACATPVVATPLAAAGLAGKAIAGHDLMVAEGAEALAQTLLALLSDSARRAQIGQAGRAYVERHHSWEAIGTQLEGFYETTIAAMSGAL